MIEIPTFALLFQNLEPYFIPSFSMEGTWKPANAKISIALILLNNLISYTHIWISANQITSYNVFVQIHKLNDKQCRFWSDGFLEAIWSIYTVCKSRGCHEQQDKG